MEKYQWGLDPPTAVPSTETTKTVPKKVIFGVQGLCDIITCIKIGEKTQAPRESYF